ncbi:xanthotoxin 5-hydroxylase CYP82C4-like [Magnolia sinica]|uniref:xanthotoxin 5-hydroxylase CYP82C4-like n=1 Tax=Magnolia sinica TaxID=86752 RepID=UPI00265B5B62|nr:xanthotoxin 5-hydroxylase CYP82C4-like [Magnolia sinica]
MTFKNIADPKMSQAVAFQSNSDLSVYYRCGFHGTLGVMADKYGPVFMPRLGTRRTLIVSGWEIAEECFTTNDKVQATRPKSASGDNMSYNYAMFGFAPYGACWRAPMQPAARTESIKIRQLMERSSYLSGVFVVSDALPFLKWMDLQGHESAMRGIAKELDTLISSWLKEHRHKRVSGETDGEQDFMYVMVSIMEDAHISSYDPDTIIKATSQIHIEAGTDTTAVALSWAVSLLINNPDVLKKAQDELDIHIGKDRNADESDIKNLTYLQAIVKETLRLYPPAPLAIPHMAMEDCQIGGYHVAKGTHVMLNLWRVHRDPSVWLDPSEFRPERFLTTHVGTDVKGQNFELIPFGSGRRSCPGMSLALPVLHLTLARLLHGFDLSHWVGLST